jgi:hypothetical protein
MLVSLTDRSGRMLFSLANGIVPAKKENWSPTGVAQQIRCLDRCLCVQSSVTPYSLAKIIQENFLLHFELFIQTSQAIATDRHDDKIVAPLSTECLPISNNKNLRRCCLLRVTSA